MNVAKCVKNENELNCQGISVLNKEQNLLKLTLSDTTGVLFTHELGEFIACTGSYFQVYVWGKTKHTIWLLEPGENTCIIFKNVFLDECADALYVVSGSPNACNGFTLNTCEKELLERIKLVGNMPLFILRGLSFNHDVLNLVNHDDLEACHQKLLVFMNKTRPLR
ncbi:MAG: hypothetical protein QXE10_02225 [Desulfurococcaceae archaeon]|jgi:hypothetical protein